MSKSEKIFLLIVYVALLIFFAVLYPIPVMDGDDFTYIIDMRPAFPVPGMWNPTRVFPELFMPVCGNIAGVLAAMNLGGFINCQVFVVAAVLSFFICMYVYVFQLLMKKRFNLSGFVSVCFAAVFLLLHFLIFRVGDTNNQYMFKAADACCIFNYTIPAILSCSLVMLFMGEKDERSLFSKSTPVRSSLLILAIYLTVLSHLYPSSILAVYCGYSVLARLVRGKGKKVLDFVKENSVNFSILAFWFFVAVWEAFGNRAQNIYGADADKAGRFIQSVQSLLNTLFSTGILFKLIAAAVIFAAVIAVLFFSSKAEKKAFLLNVAQLLCIGVICAAFIVILSALTGAVYNTRPEVIFPLVFIEFFFIMICAEFVLRHFKFVEFLLPLIVLIVFSGISTESRTFQGSNYLGLDSNVALDMQNDICDQIIAAAEEGLDEVTVYVCRTADDWANWPQNLFIGDTLAEIFYKFGITDSRVDVTMVPSEFINELYGITAN